MPGNGWTFYDILHEPSPDWPDTLKALSGAVHGARDSARGWPRRDIEERITVIRAGDVYEPHDAVDDAITVAAADENVLKVRWDLSQGGTDDPREPEYMRIRSYQLTAARESGLTLYASSPIESDVPQLLAAAQAAARAAVVGDVDRGWWQRLRAVDRVIRHPVVSTLVAAGLLALVTLVGKLLT
jgi:hypothetical protein